MATDKRLPDIFAQTDLEGETAGPDDDFDETAGPEDDDDTAAAELEADEADTGDIRALQRRGRTSLSLEEGKTLLLRGRSRGKKIEAKKKRPRIKAPQNLVPPNESVVKLMDKWRGRGDMFIIRQDGHYYFVCEIRCTCEGGPTRAWLRIKGNMDYRLFHVAVGDDTTFLGNSAKVTTNITNLQRPSKNTYTEQDFLVKSITMQEAGLRVKYDPAEVEKINGLGEARGMLNGEQWLWDDSGTFLPEQIFHDTTGENLLYRALRRSAVLYFMWDETRTGGNGTIKRVLVDHLRSVPDTKEKSMSRTSGGAPVLSVPDGYVFSDNPEQYGAFTAAIRVEEDILFPIKPIDIGGGSPLKPIEVGLYVQLSLNGIGFQPKKKA